MGMFSEIAIDGFKDRVLEVIDRQIASTTDEQTLASLTALRSTIASMS